MALKWSRNDPKMMSKLSRNDLEIIFKWSQKWSDIIRLITIQKHPHITLTLSRLSKEFTNTTKCSKQSQDVIRSNCSAEQFATASQLGQSEAGDARHIAADLAHHVLRHVVHLADHRLVRRLAFFALRREQRAAQTAQRVRRIPARVRRWGGRTLWVAFV